MQISHVSEDDGIFLDPPLSEGISTERDIQTPESPQKVFLEVKTS